MLAFCAEGDEERRVLGGRFINPRKAIIATKGFALYRDRATNATRIRLSSAPGNMIAFTDLEPANVDIGAAIKSLRASGLDDDKVRDALVEDGFEAKEIDLALNNA